ncbi:hypothetical protein B0H17DRAFT_1147361 [Mycena rosella]|uniref:Uncharacterized protein n=1 Tax=Mycena rosella TaxID=1033263 RepID=A0AAD7CM02_MYCRO|nr:hypothetical protein B0H17DRAFT_1147361 [Mycena rosella]
MEYWNIYSHAIARRGRGPAKGRSRAAGSKAPTVLVEHTELGADRDREMTPLLLFKVITRRTGARRQKYSQTRDEARRHGAGMFSFPFVWYNADRSPARRDAAPLEQHGYRPARCTLAKGSLAPIETGRLQPAPRVLRPAAIGDIIKTTQPPSTSRANLEVVVERKNEEAFFLWPCVVAIV